MFAVVVAAQQVVDSHVHVQVLLTHNTKPNKYETETNKLACVGIRAASEELQTMDNTVEYTRRLIQLIDYCKLLYSLLYTVHKRIQSK